ncbi:uncharacterized protein LOC114359114 [Ostrinia furnacalis]|uniref:uncharacterized protein LOC114359114 n=1 Tax=Ostrinia furnacalis TaxID=93504 RepID=UPI001038E3AA|nr:uncharacterized protein LOC114359114 [Ostrinia furnacalis]
MKVFVTLLAFFLTILTGANAQITKIFAEKKIKEISQNLTDSGYDPLEIKGFSYNYSLPVTDLLVVNATVGDIRVTGISNIELDKFRYNTLLSRITYSVTLPLITATFNKTDVRFKLMNMDLTAKYNGSVAISDINVAGKVSVNIGILSGITVRDVEATLSIGKITSNMTVIWMGQDISSKVNKFLNTTLPSTINDYNDDISEVLVYYITEAVKDAL